MAATAREVSTWATPEARPVEGGTASAHAQAGAGTPAPGSTAAAGVAVARGDAAWSVERESLPADRSHPLAELEPVGVGGVLDGGFELLRFGFGPLVGLAAAMLLPLQLVELLVRLRLGLDQDTGAMPSAFANMATLGSEGAWTWVPAVLRVFVLSLLGVAAGVMVTDLLDGHRRRGAQLASAAGRRWWVALLLPVLTVPVKSAGACLVYVGFFLADALLMCASVVAGAEGGGPLRSFARSWRLGFRSFGTAIGVSVGAFLISYILQVALWLGPVLLVSTFVTSATVLLVVQQVSLLVLLVTQPLTAAIAARAYVELRCRNEGLDLQRRRVALGLVS